jgi:signal transduction histidine kinase
MLATRFSEAYPPFVISGSRPERTLVPVSPRRLTVSERSTFSRAEYREAFDAYVESAHEVPHAGALIARQALQAGASLPDFMENVVSAVTEALRSAGEPARADRVLEATGSFVRDSLSPFAEEWKAALESNRGLRSQNDRLEERVRRIAHEIHDSSAQFLASVHAELHRANEVAPAEIAPRLARIHTLLNQVESDLHRFSHELRPTILDDLGLVPALHELSRSVGRENGMVIAVEGPPDGRYSPAVELALYRTVQDALSGAEKYGRARRVRVKVETSENEIRCSISDDGPGKSKTVSRSSWMEQGPGLIGIRERLAALGGTLACESRADGRGSRLVASIPLEVRHVASRFGR